MDTVAGTELSVAIVQGNVPQDQKFVPEHREEIVRRYIGMTSAALAPNSSCGPRPLAVPLGALEGPFWMS